jgi:pimeloyl-ACP methyl ester carboxylesterase
MYANKRPLIINTILVLAGCTRMPNISVRDIQGRKVAYACKGEGSPVIVLESGMGPSMSTWAPIFENLSQITRVFAYDRPGYGRSTQNQVPETGRELADQLHQNLASTDHAPPYLLVGHSAGGLYLNIFARMFPEEVVGVVLIDSTHPFQFEYFKKY